MSVARKTMNMRKIKCCICGKETYVKKNFKFNVCGGECLMKLLGNI